MNRENSIHRAGDLDTSFGIKGRVTLSILPGPILDTRLIKGVLALPDNKILVSLLLETSTGIGQYALARLTRDGALDQSFGDEGVLIDSFKDNDAGGGGRLLRLADGRLLMLGHNIEYRGVEPIPHLAMACYTGDYELDKTFGESGTGHLVINNPSDDIYLSDSGKVAQQADGKLLVSTTYQKFGDWRKTTGVLYRLHPNGTLDKTFNDTGRLDFRIQDPDASTALSACLVQADGKIVVAGHAYFQPVRETALIARFDDKGVLDRTFGPRNSPGYHTVPVNNRSSQFNDLLSMTGGFVGLGQVGSSGEVTTEGMLVGITKEGLADSGFNDGTPVLTKYGQQSDNSWLDGYVQSDGKLVITAARHQIFLSRWLSNGKADNEFGTNGHISQDYSNAVQPAIVVSRPENKILWSGNPSGISGGIGTLMTFLG